MKAFESSAKTRSDKKRQLFARILAARIEQDDLVCHSPEDYLSVITQLSESEISLAEDIRSHCLQAQAHRWDAIRWRNCWTA